MDLITRATNEKKCVPAPCSKCGCNSYSIDQFSEPFSIWLCNGCGLARTLPPPTAEQLLTAYGKDYYTTHSPLQKRGLADIVRDLVSWTYWNFHKPFPEILKPVLKLILWPLKYRVTPVYLERTAFILDIGCGNGARLLEYSQAGFTNLFGQDPTAGAAKVASSLKIAEIYNCSLAECGFKPETFDLIILNQVLEHVDSPSATLAEIFNLLKTGGALYISVPNYGSTESRLFRMHWSGLRLPEHLHHFKPKQLKEHLIDAGFEIALARTDSIAALTEESYLNSVRSKGRVPIQGISSIRRIFLSLLTFFPDRFGRGQLIRMVAIKR